MKPAVIFLDGPIGVGKTSLGRAAAMSLNLGFIDGDDHSAPGHWLRSILRTSHKIVAASLDALRDRPAVIVAYGNGQPGQQQALPKKGRVAGDPVQTRGDQRAHIAPRYAHTPRCPH